VLAALHGVPELQPGAEPRDSGRGRPGHRDHQLVAESVGVEVPPGGKPALPLFGASELVDGLAGVFAVGAAALSALLVAQHLLSRSGHGWTPFGVRSAGCGADPDHPRARARDTGEGSARSPVRIRARIRVPGLDEAWGTRNTLMTASSSS
jgi:hypothetical protein